MNKVCVVCGKNGSEEHHRVYRSECKALEKCKANKVYLCNQDHRGTYGVHGKHGDKLNRELKLEFQNWLELQFLKHEYTQEEIGEILGISDNAVRSLCKLLTMQKGMYIRENIIIWCMGGKLIDTCDRSRTG